MRESSQVEASSVITEADVEFYRTNGWVRANKLISPETARVLYDRIRELGPSLVKDSSKTLLLNNKTEAAHRIYDDPTWIDEDFRAAATSPRVVDFAKSLIGTDRVRFFRATCFEKPPTAGGGIATTLHQDFPYLPVDRSGSIQIWIALSHIPASMGTLQFISGTHRAVGSLGRVNADDEEQEMLSKRLGPDVSLSDPFDLEAGDATAHNDLTVHYAGPNHAAEPRIAFAVVYMRPDAKYTGASYYATDGLGLEIGKPLDHDRFPVFG
jgi:ectoine hydroxylase-related dioxygenase (phytanoyl-CoA dioxygenase family)